MNVFEIIGPSMVGPSSSHTAGAVKIGLAARQLFGNHEMNRIEILLYGSFLATGPGHGTDKAVLAGLLGFEPDDERVPDSLEIAQRMGLGVTYGAAQLRDAHPNTAVMILDSEDGKHMEVQACSLGGGRIMVNRINDLNVDFSAEYPTLIVSNKDLPGCVAEVTNSISNGQINIARMNLYRDSRHGNAVMVLECDEQIPEELLARIRELGGVQQVTYFSGGDR